MKSVIVKLPDNVDMNEREISILVAAHLYDQEKLSLGQAAELVGMTKKEFMDELGKSGVSLFGESLEDIDRYL